MGANTAKTQLDQEYRNLAARFLERVMDERGLKKAEIAKALGVDRSVGSRYLSRAVRPPLQRLSHLKRSLGIDIPEEIVEAFWASEGPPPVAEASEAVDLEHAIRTVGAEISGTTDPKAREAAKRQLEDLLRKLA